MHTLPAKNYAVLSTLNQLCLPMNVGVLIPPDDPVRLPVFVLKQLDLNPLYEAYNAQIGVEGEYIRGRAFSRRPTTGQPSSRFWNT
jgi:hypothetical protein